MSHLNELISLQISDTPWIGEIPEHWVIHHLRRVVETFVDYRGRTPEKSDDGIPLITTGAIRNGKSEHSLSPEWVSEEVYKELLKRGVPEIGDLLFTSEAPLGEVAVVEDPSIALPQRIILFKVNRSRIVAEFLKYHFIGNIGKAEIQSRASGSTAEGIRSDRLKMSLVPTPPIEEQKASASFLDHKTAAIDALIAKKQRLIELLEEKRSALINQAVTKGLNPNASMKDSGIPWIGEIPEHWKVNKLKNISKRVVVGIAEAATHAYVDSGVPIIRSTDVKPNKITISELRFISHEFAAKNRSKLINSYDLLTIRTGNAGITAVVPLELNQSQCFTMLITTLKPKYDPCFYSQFLNSTVAVNYFVSQRWGTAQDNISVPILKEIAVPEPPEDEQIKIVKMLIISTNKLDSLISKVKFQIEKLQEYRQSLITAAVTGKLDITQEEAA